MKRLLMWVACAAGAVAAAAAERAGRVVAGSDATWSIPPAGAIVEPYRNSGYELSFVDGAVKVRVRLDPVRSAAVYTPPARPPRGPVEEAARAAAGGATSEYGAVSRVLAWIRGLVQYDLDRTQAQSPEAVLRRGTAYCTGVSRLAVAMLGALGIQAREVPGYVLEDLPSGARAGFHRWIEVRFADTGWTFSDPLSTHHFVPATYLRLASDRLEDAPGVGRLLGRAHAIEETDLAVTVPADLLVRPNQAGRRSAALVLVIEGADSAEAVLDGAGGRRTLRLEGGRGRFLGLEPGRYELRVSAGGRLAARKALVFHAPVLAEIVVAVGGLAR